MQGGVRGEQCFVFLVALTNLFASVKRGFRLTYLK